MTDKIIDLMRADLERSEEEVKELRAQLDLGEHHISQLAIAIETYEDFKSRYSEPAPDANGASIGIQEAVRSVLKEYGSYMRRNEIVEAVSKMRGKEMSPKSITNALHLLQLKGEVKRGEESGYWMVSPESAAVDSLNG